MENNIILSKNQRCALYMLKDSIGVPVAVKPRVAYALYAMSLVVFKGKQAPLYRYAETLILCEITAKGLEVLNV